MDYFSIRKQFICPTFDLEESSPKLCVNSKTTGNHVKCLGNRLKGPGEVTCASFVPSLFRSLAALGHSFAQSFSPHKSHTDITDQNPTNTGV